jgi:prevent-host-death family protein
MRQINIHEAKTHLSRLVEEVNLGEEIIIAKAGKPMAKLVPIKQSQAKRKPGLLKGKIWISEDFNTPMSEEELKLWYEGGLFP